MFKLLYLYQFHPFSTQAPAMKQWQKGWTAGATCQSKSDVIPTLMGCSDLWMKPEPLA